jgi:hypothetical protein
VEVWLAREAAERVGVQVLELRLDDDMEWRIAVVVNLTAAAASSGTPTALQDASRRTPHSPPEAARHSSPTSTRPDAARARAFPRGRMPRAKTA